MVRIGFRKQEGSAKLAFALLLVAIGGVSAITLLKVGSLSPSTSLAYTDFQPPVDTTKDIPNFLLICIDTLRADHVGFGGSTRDTTPNLDRFFSEGRIFERAYSSTAMTPTSVVSILTGLYPPRHKVRLFWQPIEDTTITIVDRLRKAGYQTAAVVSNAVLAGEAIRLSARFDYYDDHVDEQEPFRTEIFERRASRTTDAAITWLTHYRKPDNAHFLWVHYIDPHGPYLPPKDKPTDFSHDEPTVIDSELVPPFTREPGLTDGAEYIDRYDEEIAYTDREIGRLLKAYQAAGLLENTVVILTSDHGESMMDHDKWFRHEVNVYEEMIRVPLAFRGPGIIKGVVTEPVSNTSIAPTVLTLAGISFPSTLDAHSLVGSVSKKPVIAEGTRVGGGLWRTVVVGNRKYTIDHGMSNIIRNAFWYDLQSDPGELSPQPLLPNDPMFKLLDQYVRSDPDPGGVPRRYLDHGLPAPNVAPPANTNALKQLRSLGYVGEDKP